jgi:hypothetical protein
MKKRNEDNPENLGEFLRPDGSKQPEVERGDLLPAEVLKKLNELLELIHQTGQTNQGSTVINIYEKGSMHIDRVDNQNFYGDASHKPKKVSKEENFPVTPQPLSAMLRTPEAMTLWKKAQQAGYIDEHYQPKISRTQAALLADAMAERLGIKEKWKVFEGLWHRKYMYHDYYRAMEQQQSLDFQDTLKRLFD